MVYTAHVIVLSVFFSTKSLALNSDIKDSFQKFLLLFRQAEIVFVIVWFLDQFTLEYAPLVNSIWIITPAGLFHVWVTKFKTFFYISQAVYTDFAILFSEAQHVVKISTAGQVPVFFEVINLFIKL